MATLRSLYLSVDLEGVCGVQSARQLNPGPDDTAYQEAVSQLVQETRMVLLTAADQGVEKVVINDAHCAMTNVTVWDFDDLPIDVRLISGKPKPLAMAAALQSGLPFPVEAIGLLGYHTKAGTQGGTLAHTFHHDLADVRINGKSYGEVGVNALYAGICHQLPVVFVSGETRLEAEITEYLPSSQCSFVYTKEGLGFSVACHRSLNDVFQDYESAMKQAVNLFKTGKAKPLSLKAPYSLEVQFVRPLFADTAMLLPGFSRLDGCTVGYQSDRFDTLYQALQSGYTILSATQALQA
ncbi:MAG: M55 family metallopeptidase [Cyanobacteria bacterium]|nr:M55 family metallopeptidase [Cyanobacteriota bacterium]